MLKIYDARDGFIRILEGFVANLHVHEGALLFVILYASLNDMVCVIIGFTIVKFSYMMVMINYYQI